MRKLFIEEFTGRYFITLPYCKSKLPIPSNKDNGTAIDAIAEEVNIVRENVRITSSISDIYADENAGSKEAGSAAVSEPSHKMTIYELSESKRKIRLLHKIRFTSFENQNKDLDGKERRLVLKDDLWNSLPQYIAEKTINPACPR